MNYYDNSFKIIFGCLNMPINVFGNSSNNSDNKIVTGIFVRKLYLRISYIDSNIEEVIDLENQFRIKKVPDPVSIRDACNKKFVDIIFKNDNDFNDVKLEKIKFVKVNYQPAVNGHLTPKINVDNAIDEPSLVRNNQNNDFSNFNLTNINSITLNTQAVNDNHVDTKAYVDHFPNVYERSRIYLGLDFSNESSDLEKSNQDNNFNDIKVTNLYTITVNRNPNSKNDLSNKKMLMMN